jgi:ribonuclease J
MTSLYPWPQDQLLFVPLGGCGEIGMNLNAYGFQGKWLLVDCGITFADETMLGVDVIMPDPKFLVEQRDRIVALVITHAHEDHIGAVPYLWESLQCPVYATGFAASVLKRKLVGTGLLEKIPLHLMAMSGSLTLDPFTVQTITLTHSIPEPNALVIRTAAGAVLHTGDWKLDDAPVVGDLTDEKALRALAEENILAMVCDSTNVFVEENAGSEQSVADALTGLISQQKGAVAVTCFATNVARLHSVTKAANAAGRSVVLLGRSMKRIYESAFENGYLQEMTFVDASAAKLLPRESLLYLCTGSQGEERAALGRLAQGNHPEAHLEAGDTVFFSSRKIPGNEKAIGRIQNALASKGIKVITDKEAHIHVSGHPAREDLRELYSWVRPQAVIPVHGEQRHLREQADLAASCQVPHTLVIDNGDMVALSKTAAPRVIDQVPVARLALNGTRLTPLFSESRKNLMKAVESGYLVASVVVDEEGALCAPLQISMLGLLENKELTELLPEIEDYILEEIEGLTEAQFKKDATVVDVIRKCLRTVFKAENGKRPRIEVHLLRIEG